MPAILFLTQQCPWPKDSGGNIRTYFVARHLARFADVTLLAAAPATGAEEARAALLEFCAEVELLPDEKAHGSIAKAATLARSLVNGRPAFIEHNANRHIARRCNELMAQQSFDWLHINQIDAMPYAEGSPKPYVLDTHNLHWAYYRRRAQEQGNVALRALYQRDASLLKDYELSAFKQSASCLVCSDDEQAVIQNIDAHSPIHVVPNGVDCQEFDPGDLDTFSNANELIFVGDMAYPPNNDGVLEFIRETLPQVAARVPDVHLTVVGRKPSSELLRATDGRSDVTVTGFVEDVSPYLKASKLFLVPLRYGAGTRLKVPQAFASGLPTVSTTIGAEGINYQDAVNIAIADDHRDMANAICRLLNDGAAYRAMRTAALATAHEQYDWNVIGDGLIDHLQTVFG